MNIEPSVQNMLNKIESNDFISLFQEIDNSHFGLYLPSYLDGDTIKLMEDGYSQNETGLQVTINKEFKTRDELSKVVAWIGSEVSSDCSHPGGGSKTCRSHCKGHGGPEINCTGHAGRGPGPRIAMNNELIAPELKYSEVINDLALKKELLGKLAEHGFGLYLLHAHNDQFEFTMLPSGYVSVIVNDRTEFRKLDVVQSDSSFVPNIWRVVDGELEVAGGYSTQ